MEKMIRIIYGYFVCYSIIEKFIVILLKFYVIVINWKKKSRWFWCLWVYKSNDYFFFLLKIF